MELPTELGLEIDFEEVLFRQALRGVQEAATLIETLRDREGDLKWLDLHDLFVMWDMGDEIDVPTRAIGSAAEQAKEALGLILQGLVAAHVFGVMTLEAHINRRAGELLSGSLLRNFARLSLEGKWLLLPRLACKETFDSGTMPFQGFKKLVSVRNELVHSSPGTEDRFFPLESGPLAGAGAALGRTKLAIQTVRAMATELASMLGDSPPAWVRGEGAVFFHLTTQSPSAAHRTGEQEMWALMSGSEVITELSGVGLIARPHDVLKHESLWSCVKALGGEWFKQQDGHWRLVGPEYISLHHPGLSAVLELPQLKVVGDWAEVKEDPLEQEYQQLRAQLHKVLESHELSLEAFLRS